LNYFENLRDSSKHRNSITTQVDFDHPREMSINKGGGE